MLGEQYARGNEDEEIVPVFMLVFNAQKNRTGEKVSRIKVVTIFSPIVFVISFFTGACSSIENTDAQQAIITEIDSPAQPGSAEPNLTRGDDGKIYLSWVEKLDDGFQALKFSRWSDSAWSEPVEIARGEDWFVNWADFPTLGVTRSGNMMASWLKKSGSGTYSYDVNFSLSTNSGKSWSDPLALHSDGVEAEHGFVSITPICESEFAAVWLDGRETIDEGGAMTLRYATVSSSGEITDETLLDSRVCDCCQTSITITGTDELIVVYRGRSAEEIRDIVAMRFDGVSWSNVKSFPNDNWNMPACPVNGPSICARDSLVAACWYAGGGVDSTSVKVSFSVDNGATFKGTKRIDAGSPDGRVDLCFLTDSTVLASWLETSADKSRILARVVSVSGGMSEISAISETDPSRASGFPQLATLGENMALVAWTQTGKPGIVRTAIIDLN